MTSESRTPTRTPLSLDGDDVYLEFHHLSGAHCKASSIASYVMEKLKVYAIRHNIVPR